MSNDQDSEPGPTVRQRLLDAARACFLSDDYHAVGTRRLAALAGVNVSMISYYFGSKQGLYEEMIRELMQPMLDVLDGEMAASLGGLRDYLGLYYRTMAAQPEFPRLILKVLALRQGPGRRFIVQLLERGRARGARRVGDMKASGELRPDVDPDVLRMAFVSLAMTPILLKDIFEEQLERPMDAAFLEQLATFNGQLLAAGLARMAAPHGDAA